MGVDSKTVEQKRDALESTSEIPKCPTAETKDGRSHPRKQKAAKSAHASRKRQVKDISVPDKVRMGLALAEYFKPLAKANQLATQNNHAGRAVSAELREQSEIRTAAKVAESIGLGNFAKTYIVTIGNTLCGICGYPTHKREALKLLSSSASTQENYNAIASIAASLCFRS